MLFLFYSHDLVKEMDKQAKNGVLIKPESIKTSTATSVISSLKTHLRLVHHLPLHHFLPACSKDQLPSHQMPHTQCIFQFLSQGFGLVLPADGTKGFTIHHSPGQLSSFQSTGYRQQASIQSRTPNLCAGSQL